MRCDYIEFRWLPKAAKQRRISVAMGSLTNHSLANHEGELDATDEAFASFGGAAKNRVAPSIDRTLVTKLASQLEELDRQREHLAKLLSGIEIESGAAPSAAL
jgi:hypothetical protein